MKRRVKRYDDGGEVIDLRDDTSQPTGIDDDVRARARRFLETGKKDEEVAMPTPRVKSRSSASSTTTPPKPSPLNFAEEKARLEKIDKPVEKAYPEDYIPGVGNLKGLARQAGRMVEKQAALSTMKDITPKTLMIENEAKKLLPKPVNKAEEMAARRAARAEASANTVKRDNATRYGFDPDNASRAGLNALRRNIGDGEFTMKKGGLVPSRGDGCAQRGKTKGRLR